MRDFEADMKLCEKATKGPWSTADTTDGYYVLDSDGDIIAATIERASDTWFIAEAREGWPAALKEIERLSEENHLLKIERDQYKGTMELATQSEKKAWKEVRRTKERNNELKQHIKEHDPSGV